MIDAPAAPGPTPTPAAEGGAVASTGPRVLVAARCAGAGLCLAASIPPWGWWPLAFIGIALLDRLIAHRPWRSRFARTWVAAAFWLYPAMLWMFDLTAPGYLVAGSLFATYYAVAAAATPAGPARRVVFPGAMALAEGARWSWPFGGVPLAHLAMSQVDTPLLWAARIAGPLLVVVLVVVVGQALSAALAREIRPALVALGVTTVLVLAGMLHPRASVVDEIEVALVQGGGAQRTRASSDQQPVVLGRHLEASSSIDPGQVDLVIWPENVVNPGRLLDREDAYDLVADLARRLEAPVVAGWFFAISDTDTVNYQSIILPDGSEIDRYDKVRIVPFGEYVPLRGLLTTIAPNAPLPRREVLAGQAEPVLDTPVGPIGVSISWEGFFEHRARHSVREGAELLTNPTNGASYWLTQVQTQQVASNRLRAMENDRWVLQVAPTGYSAVIDPAGDVRQRTDISERAVLIDTVEMRQGRTLASRVGWWPVVLYGLGAVAGSAALRGRDRRANGRPSAPVG